MLQGIMKVLQFQKLSLSGIETAFEDIFVEKELYLCFKSDGLSSLLCLLQEHFRSETIDVDESIHKKSKFYHQRMSRRAKFCH